MVWPPPPPPPTRSPATSVRTSAGQISSTSSPQVNKSRITPRLPVSYSPKYEALANKEANVRLSAVPAKLQSLLSRFDPDGDGVIDTTELAKAVSRYHDEKFTCRRRTLCLCMLVAVVVAALAGTLAATLAKDSESSPSAVSLFINSGKKHELGSNYTWSELVPRVLNKTESEVTYIPIEHLAQVSENAVGSLRAIILTVNVTAPGTKPEVHHVGYFVANTEHRDGMLILQLNGTADTVMVFANRAYRIRQGSAQGAREAESVLVADAVIINTTEPRIFPSKEAMPSSALLEGVWQREDLLGN
mmetsp:Transcript_475/g.1033  ORF Transcript_475/g.1033 Transcript_475/m.1033 type:complete len:303 (+) Transcript_475:19-927(+)